MHITSCSGDSLLRGREDGVIHRSRMRILEPAHVELFHSSLSSDGTQKRKFNAFIYTYIQTELSLTLYCIMFCTILSIALTFAFVTELLAAVFELCPLSSFLAAGSLLQWCWESTAGMRKGTLLSGRGRSPVGT